MANYDVVFGYKAVITVSVKSESEKEAKDLAKILFEKNKDKMFKTNVVTLQDDSYSPDGITNMDKTWNELYK